MSLPSVTWSSLSCNQVYEILRKFHSLKMQAYFWYILIILFYASSQFIISKYLWYHLFYSDIFNSIINPVKIQFYLMHAYLLQFLTDPLHLIFLVYFISSRNVIQTPFISILIGKQLLYLLYQDILIDSCTFNMEN